MKKYVTYITYYKGDLLPPFYIGSTNSEKISKGYNGSIVSKKWSTIYKKEQKENKHLFRTKILSYHETREEALEEELRLQKKHNVVKNEKYFNESYASINGMFGRDVTGSLNPNYGNKYSEEFKNIISERTKVNTPRGNKVNTAIKVNIYNKDSKLQYECYGNFQVVCKENNLPYKQLENSYKREKPIFSTPQSVSQCSEKNKKYIGWYAVKLA